jgi:hypothetical protein
LVAAVDPALKYMDMVCKSQADDDPVVKTTAAPLRLLPLFINLPWELPLAPTTESMTVIGAADAGAVSRHAREASPKESLLKERRITFVFLALSGVRRRSGFMSVFS